MLQLQILFLIALFSLILFLFGRPKSLYRLDVSESKQVNIKALFLYPVKGIKGIEVPFLRMTESGAEYDRLFVIVDKNTLIQRTLCKCEETIPLR